MTDRRLIEVAFPIKQASIDSVHEKSVRHGHISTLHIWPARRPLAASRAALIATLLPDPGTKEERDRLLLKLAGKVVTKTKTDGDGSKVVEETEGGILHWGRETSPDLAYFRELIREAYGGRAPRVLDPFSGGGAIPLEAMRMGCEVTANDLNPVAWFILKCTLEYPQRLAGQKYPLPDFAIKSPSFMGSYLKGTRALKGKKLEKEMETVQLGLFPPEDADLAWHIRAWGQWVLEKSRADLERFYPVVDGASTVAYLWARTVQCKHCRAEIPLLKTRWLAKKKGGKKRVLLKMQPNHNNTGVVFDIETDVPQRGGNAAQKSDYDKQLGAGTMNKSGATCPCCGVIMTMEDLRLEGRAERLGTLMTSVVVEGKAGKAYRLPTQDEIAAAMESRDLLDELYSEIPFGLPKEPTPGSAGAKKNSSSLRLYGLMSWKDMFTSRQLLGIGTFLKNTRSVREVLKNYSYTQAWCDAIGSELALCIDKLADYIAALCTWHVSGEKMSHVFVRFAFPMNWDFAELNPLSEASGGYIGAVEWVAQVVEHVSKFSAPLPTVLHGSATSVDTRVSKLDAIVTDPPYYDAISYSDIMDFFYVWLRRTLYGMSSEIDAIFQNPLSPKWNHVTGDGELIDNPAWFDDDKTKSKQTYEDGMFRAFQACHHALVDDGRLVIVFAHKQPDAWETLVSAIIRAGFVVDGSWPIQTEMGNRTRALSSAALSSSVWLVCRKRPETARPGWDNRVLENMRANITVRLRDYWDAGIRGPDFVWAATGPAMEAYSQHPVVKKADEPGAVMGVEEFLGHVRRMVVDFMVGQVLSREGGETTGLDDVTTYYLLHRKDFGMGDAPASACILYALSCGLTDRALSDQYDILNRGSAPVEAEIADDADQDSDEVDESDESGGSGSTVRLQAWTQRVKRKTLGYEAPGGRPAPLIDQAHRLLALWKVGDVVKVDQFLDEKGLRRSGVFAQLLQALIELASGEERALLESISNHFVARGASPSTVTTPMFSKTDD
jgi:adenine-specific DNA methylase